MDKVLAVLISYNPDILLLKKSIESLYKQVHNILIFDNNSLNIDQIKVLTNKFSNIILIENEINDGLPKNYNRALNYAKKYHYKWLLTMDQDTVLPNEMISKFLVYEEIQNVAIICPLVFDNNIKEMLDNDFDKKCSYIENCISSGSLINVDIAFRIGCFDDKLFIDNVDFDYCKRVIINNYKIIRINDCVINHQVGEAKIVKFLGKKEIIYNHSAFRKYYFFRNRVYFIRKYKYNIVKDYKYFRNLFKYFILILYEDEAIKKYKNALKGFIDGLYM